MLDPIVVEKLRERYNKVHPLIFHRSVEHAKSAGELFDILETIPRRLPILWDEQKHQWVHTEDLTLESNFDFESMVKRKIGERR